MLIDVALHRAPHFEASAALLGRIERGAGRACIAWHTVSNVYYVVRGIQPGIDTRGFLAALTRFVEVAAGGAEAVRYAASLPMADFEDALQVAAARAAGASHVVTRNLGDYERSPIPAIAPPDALRDLLPVR